MIGLVGKKVGMTRIFTEDGVSIPVTVIEIEANRVTQVKDLDNDGYRAVQVTTGSKKANRVTKPEAGHFAKAGVEAGRGLWEFRLAEGEEFTAGQNISVGIFVPKTLPMVTPWHTVDMVQSVRTRLQVKCLKERKWQANWVTNA